MKRFIWQMSVCGMLLLSSCSIFKSSSEPTTTPTAELTSVPANQVNETNQASQITPTVLPPTLNLEALKNSVYFAPQAQQQVHLNGGHFETGSNSDDYSVDILPQIAIGDINGDKVDDAAVILAENTGGTGVFHSLVVITSDNGEYQQIGDIYIDDRPIIESVEIEDGCVDLRATIHDAADIMVSPTLYVRRKYCVIENDLILMRQDSKHERSSERLIEIDSPTNGSEVTTGVQLSGGMPIAPFENNLSLKIYDLDGNELMASGFMVNSENMGLPATFNTLVTLPVLPSGSKIRIELAELSMLDGSMQTMNSVYVIVK